MALSLVIVAVLCVHFGRGGATPLGPIGETLAAKRPDLGVYQDIMKETFELGRMKDDQAEKQMVPTERYHLFTESQCPSEGATWHVMYRNTEHGDFGDDDRCLTAQLTEAVGDMARFRFRYGAVKRHERNGTHTFKAPPGQSYKTILEKRLDGASGVALYDLLFVDCNNCKIMKRRGGNKCVLSVKEAVLRKYVPHCHFVYDLLCGPATKYPVSDASCLDGTKWG